jgi:hypothetical protein
MNSDTNIKSDQAQDKLCDDELKRKVNAVWVPQQNEVDGKSD